MGYMNHHAIVVVDHSYGDHIERAQSQAKKIGLTVSELVESPTNGHRSFFCAPDGSKEGWPESDIGDAQRASFIEYLNAQRYYDGSSPLDWCEVSMPEDRTARVVRSTHERDDSATCIWHGPDRGEVTGCCLHAKRQGRP